MFIEEMLGLSRYRMPVFAPADEGAGGEGGEGDANGDDTKGDADQNDDTTGGVVLDGGGTADGDDTSDDDDKGGKDDDTKDDDDKSDDKNKSDDADDDDDDAEDQGAPDEYDFNDLMPEGVELDQAMVDGMTPILRDLDLSQDKANALVKAYTEIRTAEAEAEASKIVKIMEGWVSDAKADKEIGGDKWKDTVTNANLVLKKFGTPELINDVMVGQGVGNHPEVIRFVARIAAAVSDDVLISGDSTDTTSQVEPEVTWYGDTTPTTKKG